MQDEALTGDAEFSFRADVEVKVDKEQLHSAFSLYYEQGNII